MDVYVVTVETGTYSDYECHLDSVYADEADAVSRIVRDYHGELSDTYSQGGLAWEVDDDWAGERWGDCYRDHEWIPRTADAPEWWDERSDYPIVCRIWRMPVIGT